MFFTVTDAFNPASLIHSIGALQLGGLRPETPKEQLLKRCECSDGTRHLSYLVAVTMAKPSALACALSLASARTRKRV
jgi:hypothetical protein